MCDELTYGNNSNEYKMIMLVGDLCDEKVAQQTNVQSNMLGITQDIVNKLLILSETSEVYQIIPESISSKPFIDNLPDLVAGWETSFTMRLKFNTECTLPFSS
jgi:predicted ATP-dependent Lon-type protease